MSRSNGRLRTALAPPLWLALVLLLSGAVPAAPAAGQPLALESPNRYCYRWSFLNNTGTDADDLHLRLVGPMGTADASSIPFGAPAAGSGYDPSTNTTTLDFGGATAFNGEVAEIGLCTTEPQLRLAAAGRVPPFVWTSGGSALEPAPLFLGLAWSWQAGNGVRLLVSNGSQQTLTLWSITVVNPSEPLLLEDLTGETIATLPALAVLPEEPVSLAAGASYEVTLTLDTSATKAGPTGNRPLAVSVVASPDEDLGNQVVLNSEALTPLRFFLPLLLKR